MIVHQYVCMHNLHRLMYIHRYVCTCSVVFYLAIDSPLLLKVARQARPNLPLQDYVTKPIFTEMPTRKYQSKRLVLLVVVVSASKLPFMLPHIFMYLHVHVFPFFS
jgi:hypothetical protein